METKTNLFIPLVLVLPSLGILRTILCLPLTNMVGNYHYKQHDLSH